MKNQWWILTSVLILGLILRIIAISERGIWYDDAFSIFLAQRSLGDIVNGTAADTMPPLYYFLLHIWLTAGQSITWIRLLNVLLSLAVVFMLFLIGRDISGWNTGLAAAFLGAISPLQIYHAQEVRMYSLLVLTQLAYVWFFYQIWRMESQSRSSRLTWLALIVCGTAAMYSHNLAVFGLAAPTLFLLLQRRWRLLLKILGAQAAIAVLALPWLLLVPGQIDKIQRAFWTPLPGMVEVLQALILFTGNLPLPLPWMAVALFLALAVIIILIIESRRWYRYLPDIPLLMTWILLPPGLLFVMSYMMRPVFVPRGFLISMMVFMVLAGALIAYTWSAGVGKVLMGAFVAAALVSLPYQYTYSEFPRSPYQKAAAYLETVVQPGEMVIHDNKLSYFPMAFYQPQLPQTFVADEMGSHNDTLAFVTQSALSLYADPDIEYAAGASEQVYFVVFSKAIKEYEAAGLDEHPQLKWLREQFRYSELQIFGDLEIYEFSMRD
jgi:mannosyltransferase